MFVILERARARQSDNRKTAEVSYLTLIQRLPGSDATFASYFGTTAVMSISSSIPWMARPEITRNVLAGIGLPSPYSSRFLSKTFMWTGIVKVLKDAGFTLADFRAG